MLLPPLISSCGQKYVGHTEARTAVGNYSFLLSLFVLAPKQSCKTHSAVEKIPDKSRSYIALSLSPSAFLGMAYVTTAATVSVPLDVITSSQTTRRPIVALFSSTAQETARRFFAAPRSVRARTHFSRQTAGGDQKRAGAVFFSLRVLPPLHASIPPMTKSLQRCVGVLRNKTRIFRHDYLLHLALIDVFAHTCVDPYF